MIKILGNHYHHFITEQIKKIPGVEFTVVPKIEDVINQSLEQIATYDLLLVQSHEEYFKVKHLPIKKIILEHTTPFPLFSEGNKYWGQISADKYVKKIVFLTEDQSMRWQCNITDHVVIAPTIDINAHPKWDAKKAVNKTIISICHDLPKRNWVCGADVWKQTTQGLPRILIGRNNQALGTSQEGVVGEWSLSETLEFLTTSSVFFNHTLHSTLPATLMEAMAIGIPIVTTASYFAVRVLGKNFATVSNVLPELRNGLIKKLNTIDAEGQEKINERNWAFLREHYSFEAFAENWKGLFERCLV